MRWARRRRERYYSEEASGISRVRGVTAGRKRDSSCGQARPLRELLWIDRVGARNYALWGRRLASDSELEGGTKDMTVTSEGVRREGRPVDFHQRGSSAFGGGEGGQGPGARVRRPRGHPGCGGLLGQGRVPVRVTTGPREAGPHRRDHLRGVRLRRLEQRRLWACDRRACARVGQSRYFLARPERARDDGHTRIGVRGAEAALAAAHGQVREDRVLRPHRTGGG